jgi:hypothetical protein
MVPDRWGSAEWSTQVLLAARGEEGEREEEKEGRGWGPWGGGCCLGEGGAAGRQGARANGPCGP